MVIYYIKSVKTQPNHTYQNQSTMFYINPKNQKVYAQLSCFDFFQRICKINDEKVEHFLIYQWKAKRKQDRSDPQDIFHSGILKSSQKSCSRWNDQ